MAEIAELRAGGGCELRQENEFMKKSRLTCEGTSVTERHRGRGREEGRYPVSSMCRWSGVSKSGYYSWRDRPESMSAIRGRELAVMVKDIFEDS